PEQIASVAAMFIGRTATGCACGMDSNCSFSCSIDDYVVQSRASDRVPFGELPFEVTTFQAYNLKNFVSTLFSRNERDGRLCNSKIPGYELDGGFVRSSFKGRSVQSKNQFIFSLTAKRRFPCVRNDAHLQLDGRTHRRSPNKAVPMRTMVAPSSIAT